MALSSTRCHSWQEHYREALVSQGTTPNSCSTWVSRPGVEGMEGSRDRLGPLAWVFRTATGTSGRVRSPDSELLLPACGAPRWRGAG